MNDIVRHFRRDSVLVGIPEDENARNDPDAPIGNAALLAMNDLGSPRNNIPARPVMKIGIRNAQEEIAEQFKVAATRALSVGLAALAPAYERVGIIASNSVKKAINDQEGIEPPAEATLRIRKARGFKGTKALVVTAQMRNAITYVVKP